MNLSSFPPLSSIIYRYNSKAANLPVYCFGILTLIYSLNYLLATPGNRSKKFTTIWNHVKLLLVRCYKFHSEQIIINHQDVKHFSLNNFPSSAWGAICLMLFAFKVGIHHEAVLVYWLVVVHFLFHFIKINISYKIKSVRDATQFCFMWH